MRAYTAVFAGSSRTKAIRRKSDKSLLKTASISFTKTSGSPHRRTVMDNITKQLQGCSKAELIEVIMEMKRHSIGIGVIWESAIANARLRTIEGKIDAVLRHERKLQEKLNAIPKESRVIWDSETQEILNEFQKSNENYVKLSKLHDKIFDETYRK